MKPLERSSFLGNRNSCLPPPPSLPHQQLSKVRQENGTSNLQLAKNTRGPRAARDEIINSLRSELVYCKIIDYKIIQKVIHSNLGSLSGSLGKQDPHLHKCGLHCYLVRQKKNKQKNRRPSKITDVQAIFITLGQIFKRSLI